MWIVIISLVKVAEYDLQLINGQIQQIVLRRTVQVTRGTFIYIEKFNSFTKEESIDSKFAF